MASRPLHHQQRHQHHLTPLYKHSPIRTAIVLPSLPREVPPTSAAAPPIPGAVSGPINPMSQPHAPPPLPPKAAAPLYKHKSWSPDIYRDEAWRRRKGSYKNRRTKSVTDEDLDELKGCIELGFGFDSPESDQRLSDTLPALGLYYAVNKNYYDTVSKSAPYLSIASDSDDTPSPSSSPHTIFGPGDNQQTMKTRLKQWAQVVACSVRQYSR